MQAQATNSAGAASSDAPQSFLQNPKVQIGVIVVGALALIGVIWMVFFSGGSGGGAVPQAPASSVAPSGTTPPVEPTAGAYPAGDSGNPGLSPTIPGATPAATPAAPASPASPGAPGAGSPEKAPKKSPGVPVRRNAFQPNREVNRILGSIPPPPIFQDRTVAPELDVYRELYKPEPDQVVTTGEEGTEGPPIPAMRVAGVIFGSAAGPTATIQIGSLYYQAAPGKMLPEGNPVYRVERIEQDKVVLTRRWEMQGKKGVQRIEVTLAGSPGSAGGFGAPGGGYPGAAGGYPGVGGYPGLN